MWGVTVPPESQPMKMRGWKVGHVDIYELYTKSRPTRTAILIAFRTSSLSSMLMNLYIGIPNGPLFMNQCCDCGVSFLARLSRRFALANCCLYCIRGHCKRYINKNHCIKDPRNPLRRSTLYIF